MHSHSSWRAGRLMLDGDVSLIIVVTIVVDDNSLTINRIDPADDKS